MRRFVALLSAAVLVVSLAGSSLAADPVAKVDRVGSEARPGKRYDEDGS